MSTFTSQAVAKRDSFPPVRMNPEEKAGIMKGVLGVEKLTPAGAGTFIKLISIPSNARLHALDYTAQQLGTSVLDIAAFYQTTLPKGGKASVAQSLAGALISSSAFVANIAGVDTGIAWTTGLGVATTPGVGVQDNPLWQVLGLTQDPEGEIDLGFTVRTASTVAGYCGLKASYVD